jgi:predicted transcriptional regulator
VRQLGQLEATVMQRLWALERPASVREVLEDVSQRRPLAYTTVMTVLDNLHSKGLVQREKHGKAYVYLPVSSREEHTAQMLQEVLAETEDRTAALMHLVGGMPRAEAAELLAALTERAEETT